MALLGKTCRKKCHGSVQLPNLQGDFEYLAIIRLLVIYEVLSDNRKHLNMECVLIKQHLFLRKVLLHDRPNKFQMYKQDTVAYKKD